MNHWNLVKEMLCDIYNLDFKKLTEDGTAVEYQLSTLKKGSLDALL